LIGGENTRILTISKKKKKKTVSSYLFFSFCTFPAKEEIKTLTISFSALKNNTVIAAREN